VSTLNEDGSVNLAPFSFFNVFGSHPPLVILGIGNKGAGIPKDTLRNAQRSGEFVVNLVDEALAERMARTSAPLPYGVSELEAVGLHAAPCAGIGTPRVAESPVSLECKVHDVQTIGHNRILLGIGNILHVRDGILDPRNQHLVPGSFPVIGRMQSPDGYTRTGERFSM
jgi:flavin reductase (DIM6/NTAB) family NADH-FMN oxidoreductase RutF